MFRLLGALLFFSCGLTACVATPIPDPPSLDPPDLDRIYEAGTSAGEIDIDGMAGAVDPGAVVVAVNLDAMDPPVRVEADIDGGFSMIVPGFPTHLVRMHAELDDARSPPVDFVATGGGTPVPFDPPLADCLTIPVELAFGRVAIGATDTVSIPIANDCAADVEIDAIALRVPTAGLNVVTAAPLTVAASTEAVIEVEVAPASAGPLEEVLLLSIAAPEMGRRAVTLRGSAE